MFELNILYRQVSIDFSKYESIKECTYNGI